MNRSIVLAGLLVVGLAGCGRTYVKETVVEKPVDRPVVQRETVVERPTVTRETIVAAPPACSLSGSAYSAGTLSCQAGYQYVCRDGAWERIAGSAC